MLRLLAPSHLPLSLHRSLFSHLRYGSADDLALVDREVDEAKSALDAAQARYDEVVAGVKDRKADIEKKLKALA